MTQLVQRQRRAVSMGLLAFFVTHLGICYKRSVIHQWRCFLIYYIDMFLGEVAESNHYIEPETVEAKYKGSFRVHFMVFFNPINGSMFFIRRRENKLVGYAIGGEYSPDGLIPPDQLKPATVWKREGFNYELFNELVVMVQEYITEHPPPDPVDEELAQLLPFLRQ